MRILRSARARAAVSIALMVLLLIATTLVGIVRTRDHQSRLIALEASSISAASLEHARAEFLNAANSLAAIAFIQDLSYFRAYEESLEKARQDMEQAREVARAGGRQEDVAALNDLLEKMDGFSQLVSDTVLLFLTGDTQGVNQNEDILAVAAEEIVAGLEEAAAEARASVVAQEEAAARAADVTLWLQVGLGSLALMLGATVAGGLVLTVIRPLASLRASARAIAAGDLDTRATARGPEEVSALARDINRMTEALLGRTRELEQRHRQLSLVHRAVSALSQELTIEGVLRIGRRVIAQHAGARAVFAWRVNNGQSALWNGSRGAGRRGQPLAARSERVWQAAQSGSPLLVPGGIRGTDAGGEDESLRTLYLPLGKGNSVRGVLELELADSGDAERPNMQLLETLALEMGVALERAHLYEEAQELANRDYLTGVLSHRAIQAELERALSAYARGEGPVAAVMVDVDNFKLFNDTFGHVTGDQLLRTIGARLAEMCPQGGSVGRLGGDDFLAALPHAHTAEAMTFARSFQDWLARQEFRFGGGERIPILVSCGIAVCPEDGTKRDELLAAADANLYASKLEGGRIVSRAHAQQERAELRQTGAFGLLESLVTSIDNKDHYTKAHSEKVAEYAVLLARELGHSEEVLKTLRIAGLLHDVGKICIPDRILRKPGPLDPVEYEVVKHHVVMAEGLLVDLPNVEQVRAAALHHHERFDGRGYVKGLKGQEIPLLARILSVADVFSAMVLDRPYRKGLPVEEALAELERVAGTQLDPELVPPFVRAVRRQLRAQQEEQGQPAAISAVPRSGGTG